MAYKMNWGLKNVYFLALVKNPRSRERLKSDKALFKKLGIGKEQHSVRLENNLFSAFKG